MTRIQANLYATELVRGEQMNHDVPAVAVVTQLDNHTICIRPFIHCLLSPPLDSVVSRFICWRDPIVNHRYIIFCPTSLQRTTIKRTVDPCNTIHKRYHSRHSVSSLHTFQPCRRVTPRQRIQK